MRRLFALTILIFVLAACGHPVEGGIVYRTADPNLSIFVPVPPVAPVDAPEVAPAECSIKVNWNGSEWIYHLPGQVSYDRTLVEPAKDEFFACTEQEAVDAGARKALR